jgi:hypothetical protein
MRVFSKATLAAAFAMGSIASANAATIFAAEGFETDLGSWNVGSRGTVSGNNDTGLYDFNTGGTPVNGPTGQDASNFATTGDGAFRLENGNATLLSDLFDVSGGGAAESITIGLDLKGYRTQTTRRANVEYSNDNGTSWFRVATLTGGTGTLTNAGSGQVTLTEGGGVSASGSLSTSNLTSLPGGTAYSGQAFGSQSLIRFIYDTNNDNRSLFIDNLIVSTTVVPEPGSLALLGLGGLMIGYRRRRD